MPTQRGAGRPAGARARAACAAPQFSPPRAAGTARGTNAGVRLGPRAPAELSWGWDAQRQRGSRIQWDSTERSRPYPAGAFQALKSYPSPHTQPSHIPPAQRWQTLHVIPAHPLLLSNTHTGHSQSHMAGGHGAPWGASTQPLLPTADQVGSLLMKQRGKRGFWCCFFFSFSYLAF